jgi:hypothetical protein
VAAIDAPSLAPAQYLAMDISMDYIEPFKARFLE